MAPKHLIFYDGECGLCDHIVQFVLKIDTHQQFAFAPLQGTTASHSLATLPHEMKGIDSLVLIENFQSEQAKSYVLGEAALRICWLLGGWWRIPGVLYWLPSWSYNWAYRLVARNRHWLLPSQCTLPSAENRDRFLP